MDAARNPKWFLCTQMFIFHIRSPFCPTSAESESLFWRINYSILSNFDNEEFPPTSPLSFPASRAHNIFCDDVMLKCLPCRINNSTLSRASVPFRVFEERKSRRTAIRADTRAMPSDSCNSEECWYLILQRERERKSRRVRNDVWRRGKQIERGKKNQITSWKCFNNHWSAPATELAKNRLNWKFSWYFMTGVASNKGRLENFPSDYFVIILAVLTNSQYFRLSFKRCLKYWV